MIKYITVLETDEITLDLMGRKKVFKNGEELTGNAYTKAYPKYFDRIGEVTGYGSFLSKPIFVPDIIEDFIQKEEERRNVYTAPVVEILEASVSEVKEVDIEELSEDFSIDDEEFDEDDVKIETEENN